MTKAQIGKIIVAFSVFIIQLAFATNEPLYRVSLLVIFGLVWIIGFEYE